MDKFVERKQKMIICKLIFKNKSMSGRGIESWKEVNGDVDGSKARKRKDAAH